MDRACELAEKYKGRDSYSEIYKAIKKLVGIEIVKILSSIDCIISMLDE